MLSKGVELVRISQSGPTVQVVQACECMALTSCCRSTIWFHSTCEASGKSWLSAREKESGRKHDVRGTSLDVEKEHRKGLKGHTAVRWRQLLAAAGQLQDWVGQSQDWFSGAKGRAGWTVLEDSCHSKLDIDKEEGSFITWAKLRQWSGLV